MNETEIGPYTRLDKTYVELILPCILCGESAIGIYDLRCEVCGDMFGKAALCKRAIDHIEGNKGKLANIFKHSH